MAHPGAQSGSVVAARLSGRAGASVATITTTTPKTTTKTVD